MAGLLLLTDMGIVSCGLLSTIQLKDSFTRIRELIECVLVQSLSYSMRGEIGKGGAYIAAADANVCDADEDIVRINEFRNLFVFECGVMCAVEND